MKKVILLIVSLLVVLSGSASEIRKQTLHYATHQGTELMLDYYSASDEVQPCLIYIFGGAFLMGTRHEPTVIPVYEAFVEQGWKVVAIDYRLGLKPLVDEPDVERSMFDLRRMLIEAVEVATEDLIAATNFVVENASSLAINPEQILLLGSSAGAVTACQAEYAICNDWEVAQVLPEEFNYAGVISMAGAIMTSERRLEWASEPCPMMMFHGNADSNVPYEKISLLGTRMIGSKLIADSLDKAGAPYWFYGANNVAHSLASTPMFSLRPQMLEFAERMAFGGERLQIFSWHNDLSLEERPHDFSLGDFIRANFSGE